MQSATELELLQKMYVSLLSLEATTRRISKLMDTQVKPKREPRKVELSDTQWLSAMEAKYPNLRVEHALRDCEAYYISKGQVMTRAKGAAWLKRQMEWNKPVTVPAQKKGLVL